MLHAVVIGVDAPRDPKIRPLEYACADAEGIAAVLSERADRERQITLLVGDRATKSRVARVITDELPRRVKPDDAVLLYFAGHGCPELDGRGADPSIHIVLHDTEHARLQATSIDVLSELAAWARRLQTRVVTIVLDASFNGMKGGRTFEGPGLWSGPRTRTLDRISPSRAAVGGHFALLTACSEKEVAREDPIYRHGVLTHHVIAALRGPDLEGKTLTAAMLHRAVCEPVQESTNGAQHPAVHGGGIHAPLLRLEAHALATPASGAVT
jgi:uncharacterized caspase-like protein